MDRRPLNVGSWLLRVFAWDGLVPVALIIVSQALIRLLSDWASAVELIAVSLPCVALLVRFFIGGKTISRNHCTPSIRVMQIGALVIGLLLLGIVDCVLILAPTAPPGAGPFDRASDQQIWMCIAGVYFGIFAFAMYPGREPNEPDGSSLGLIERDVNSPL